MTTATHTWAAPGSLTSLTVTLGAVANAGNAVSNAIDNTGGLALYMNLEIIIAAQASARSAGALIEVHIIPSIDGTNYSDETDPCPQFLTAIGMDAATTARRLARTGLLIPPKKFKLKFTNRTGQAFAAEGNSVNYTLHNEKSVSA
jgi:hypothetical protein